jgi:hypothetical protein
MVHTALSGDCKQIRQTEGVNEEYPQIAVQAKQEGAFGRCARPRLCPEGKDSSRASQRQTREAERDLDDLRELNPDELVNADLKQRVAKAA